MIRMTSSQTVRSAPPLQVLNSNCSARCVCYNAFIMAKKKGRRPIGRLLEIDLYQPERVGTTLERLWRSIVQPGPTARVLLSFCGLIAIGAGLLWLPVATVSGQRLLFVDALFVATSAVCVTGLSTIDVGVTLSSFGQVILLSLIQMGGLGFLTLSTGLLLSLGGRSSMLNRAAIADSLSGIGAGDMRYLLRNLFIMTFTAEAIGALLLAWRFHALCGFGFGKALWYGTFHSVSAFCNAGFALFSKASLDRGDSMVGFTQDLVVNLTLMALIVIGGLGFVVIYELREKFRPRAKDAHLSLHSKIVLSVTGVMIFGGALLFYIFESNNLFAGQPWHQAILPSFFQSITARTAGFNTVDIAALRSPTLLLLIVLMFIGGNPASCAGGVKTTSAFVIFMLATARLRGRRWPVAFNREISQETIARTATLVLLAFGIVTLVCAALLTLETSGVAAHNEGGRFMDLLFESVSAFSTTGLSTGVTQELGVGARLVVVVTMYIGRLGPLTVFVALAQPPREDKFRYPDDPIMVG